jgi:hypothetical protein
MVNAALAILLLLTVAGPATGQEIRPTLDKIKETGVVHLGYRETSRSGAATGSRRATLSTCAWKSSPGSDNR